MNILSFLFKVSLIIIFTFLPLFGYNFNTESQPLTENKEKSKIEIFSEKAQALYASLNDKDIDFSVFKLAFRGHLNLISEKKIKRDSILTIIDFSKSSKEKRMFIVDVKNKKLIYKTLVAHGMNTGGEFANKFSNRVHSNQSSIGFFVTGETYNGKKGFSLRLDGLEYTNSKVRQRGVVVHGANYVSERFIKSAGRLGRSFGCPAVPKKLSDEIINTIKNKSSFFIFYPDNSYLAKSAVLNSNNYLEKI